MILLSRNFPLEEAAHSQLAERLNIHNDPTPETLMVMYKVAEYMETIRYILNAPVLVSSWYRSKALDLVLRNGIPSKFRSQHLAGEAVDFFSPRFGLPIAICRRILLNHQHIPFDQLILEHRWVHISFAINPPRTPRGEVLSLLADGTYANGLTDKSGNRYE